MVCVRSFCWCWDTRKGSIVIGYFTGGLSVTCCLGSIIRLMIGLPVVLQNDDFQGQFPFNPLFFVFSAIYFAFHTIASFALVPAVKEDQQMFFIPTIIMIFMDVVLIITGIITVCIYLINPSPYTDFYIAGLIIGCVLLPNLVYFELVILSHFEDVFRKSDKEPLQKVSRTKCLPSPNTAESLDSASGTLV